MKKLFLLIIILSVSQSIQAQEGVKIGLRFSPIISFASVTDDNGNSLQGLDVSSRLGLSYGLMLNYGFTDNYGISSGVHIVQKGFSRQLSDSLQSSQKVTVRTVEIPLALKGRSNEVAAGMYINGLFGLSLDVRAGYKNEFTGRHPATNQPGDGTTKNSKLINPLTFSFIFGAGAEKEIDRIGTINFGLVYHRGLSNMNNKSQIGNEERIRVNYFSMNLGYFF